MYTKATIQPHQDTPILPFGISEIIDSDQGAHFTSQNRQGWAPEEDIQYNFHVLYRPQAASLIEKRNGPFEEFQRKEIALCYCHRHRLV